MPAIDDAAAAIYADYARETPDPAVSFADADSKVRDACQRLAAAHFERGGGGYRNSWFARVSALVRGEQDPDGVV